MNLFPTCLLKEETKKKSQPKNLVKNIFNDLSGIEMDVKEV